MLQLSPTGENLAPAGNGEGWKPLPHCHIQYISGHFYILSLSDPSPIIAWPSQLLTSWLTGLLTWMLWFWLLRMLTQNLFMMLKSLCLKGKCWRWAQLTAWQQLHNCLFSLKIDGNCLITAWIHHGEHLWCDIYQGLKTQCKIEFTYQSQKPPIFKVVLDW